MNISINKSIEILEKTPDVLYALLHGISEEWTNTNEGANTWSVYDVIGHLIHGENTDWLVRTNIILSDSVDKTFPAFDRFAQYENSKGKSLTQLLEEFKLLRKQKLSEFKSLSLRENDLLKTGTHPSFGKVTLAQLIATWVVHDLNHLSQISRIMAHQYKNEVGPWIEYLKILN